MTGWVRFWDTGRKISLGELDCVRVGTVYAFGRSVDVTSKLPYKVNELAVLNVIVLAEGFGVS